MYNKSKRSELWKGVLMFIYEIMPYQIETGRSSLMWEHPLAKEFEIKGHELKEAFDVLEEMKLIRKEILSDEEEYYHLTKEGFEVANNIENSKQALIPQRIIAFGTCAMAIGGLATVYVEIIKYFGSVNWFTVIVMLLLVSLGSFFVGILLTETFLQKKIKNRRP